jgi:homocysteine S-methyltransferase
MSRPPIRLMDGGLGTLLTSPPHNITFNHSHPLWSSHLLTSEAGQKELAKAQDSFVEAGADILLSATYQASFGGFAATKLSDGKHELGFGAEEAEKCMRKAVRIARQCLSQKSNDSDDASKKMVALSLGAYGATMIPGAEYSGLYDETHKTVDQLRDWHLRRLGAFFPFSSEDDSAGDEKRACWKDVDIVAFETLPMKNEIEAVRQVMGSLGKPDTKPFWISCVFPGEKNVLPDGSSVKDVVEAMLGAREHTSQLLAIPYAIGLNCTKVGKVKGLILEFEEAVEQVLRLTSKSSSDSPALVLYPDGTMGEVYNTTTKEWEKKEDAVVGSVSSVLLLCQYVALLCNILIIS